MPLSSRDAILGISDLPAPVKFHVPEWGDDVYLRCPTANDRDEWEVYCQENRGKPRSIWRAKLAAMVLSDEEGRPIFKTDEDVRRLGEKSAAAVHRVWERALEMLAISEKEVDELEKN